MDHDFDISVVVCTYNRGEMLAPALESLTRQNVEGVRFEVVVVDNNSTDNTRAVIDRFVARHADWAYVFESNQGLSYARNAGVSRARAPIVAFTDDDVRVAADWVAQVKRAFDDYPDVDVVGGKVLPRWGRTPPDWLTRAHWSPLAILDYGDDPVVIDAEHPGILVGANLCVRKQVLNEFGGFSPRFQRVKDSIGSTEDHEFLDRLWRAGKRGLYAPAAVVEAEVQDDRLEKPYHRRWHSGHGRYVAMMGTEPVPDDAPELFGVPAFFLRQLVAHAWEWMKAFSTRQEDVAFFHENEIRSGISYVLTYQAGRANSATRGEILRRTVRGIGQLGGRKLRLEVPRQRG